ncbi:MAG TPA: hypothetical protein DCG77_14500 [Sphingobacterium sp.]|nr:hypothetical protein [Sphingobacterium sp.]
MKVTLRPYQETFDNNLAIGLKNHRRVIACFPTGSGKTKSFIEVANRSTKNGRAVVIISESTKIFDQIINEAGGIEIANGVKHVNIKAGHLYIAMAQTLTRRPLIIHQLASLDFPPLIIVDEAHVGTPSNIYTPIN